MGEKTVKSIKKISIVLVIAVLLVSGCKGAPDVETTESRETSEEKTVEVKNEAIEPDTAIEGWELVFHDEFNGDKLDTSVWSHQLGTGSQFGLTDWGNNEKQYYKEDNVYLEDGSMVIEAKEETYEGKPYTSGRITTMDSFSKAYGRFEARIQMPLGEGFWPAFWMLPQGEMYGTWAASGEIDIAEGRGRFAKNINGTLHFGGQWPNNQYVGSFYRVEEGINTFHVYTLEWEPGEIRWYVDGELYQTQNRWFSVSNGQVENNPYPAPFDQPFYMLFNLAVGGNFDENRVPAKENFPAKMLVDYVRVYELTGREYMTAVQPVEVKDTLPEDAKQPIDGNYVYDQGFEDIITPIHASGALADNLWNVVDIVDFGGQTEYEVVNQDGINFIQLAINNGGTQNYSIQLIQHVPLLMGHTYKLSFKGNAEADRSIKIKIGGGENRGWGMYAPDTDIALKTEVSDYELTFKMKEDSDLMARLEFNCGLSDIDVYIGSVVLEDMTP